MASEVDICNSALALLGDEATVVSIDPAEGSAQAEHCRIFYPMARDSVLELHDWNFATTRAALAQLTNDRAEWAYRYAAPANMLRAIAVLAADAADETVDAARAAPQPFVTESAPDGMRVLYTHQAGAHLRYTMRVDDPSKFPPLVAEAVVVALAAKLAGPLLKGAEGRKEAAAQTQMLHGVVLPRAIASDVRQRRQTQPDIPAPWMSGR